MDLHDIPLPSDLDALIGLLDQPPQGPSFALPASCFRAVAARDRTSRRGIRQLIYPDNAKVVLPHLPAPGDRTHCALRGDFVLCDIIPAIIEARGRCPDLFIATLGLSLANADTLGALREMDSIGALTIDRAWLLSLP
jgi:hypothetical protein